MTGRRRVTTGGAVRGVHVNWTAPFRAGARPAPLAGEVVPDGYWMSALEVVTMVHSARAWQQYHGPIDHYTDRLGHEWLLDHGLDDLYGTVDAEVLERIDISAYDPLVYRMLGKTFAVGAFSEPVAILDTDLYLERPAAGLEGRAFGFAHFEAVGNAIYPDADQVPDPNGVMRPEWDFAQPATNMSIAYFGDRAHRDVFVDTALSFARRNHGPTDVHPHVRQTFAEQRIAPFEARRLGVALRPVVATTWDPATSRWLGRSPTADLHHTWRDKWRLGGDHDAARRYLIREMTKLAERFPKEGERLLALDERGLFRGLLLPGDTAALTGCRR